MLKHLRLKSLSVSLGSCSLRLFCDRKLKTDGHPILLESTKTGGHPIHLPSTKTHLEETGYLPRDRLTVGVGSILVITASMLQVVKSISTGQLNLQRIKLKLENKI